jgi:hypothetical protein
MLKPVTVVRRAPWLAGFSWLALSACSATSPRPPEPVDCTAADAYELQSMLLFEPGEEMTWFPSGDPTGQRAPSPQTTDATSACAMGGGGTGGAATGGGGTGGASTNPNVVTTVGFEPIDGGRCGSTQALVMRSKGHTDWGSLFGNWKIAQTAWAGAGFEGVAFWARASGDSSATLVLDTWQTSAAGAAGIAQPGEVCIVDCNAGSGTQAIDESGNILTQSYVSPPGTCGNSFQYTLTVTNDWRLYAIPFKSFFQERKPNMSPNGLDPTHINGFSFRIPKEFGIELWLDDVALFRKK